MHDLTDLELLRAYHRQGSDAAFAELVRRHVSLVYSTALRRVGIAAQAEEITQVVFVILARKAGRLRPGIVLAGWLHETARLAALAALRAERRRQGREQEACMSSPLHESPDDPAWNRFAPLLDEALGRLGRKDREALILRYFKDQKLDEVAAALQVTEAAAQRRVHRAVDKLRRYFSRRGVVLPATVLTAALAANSVHAAPAALAQTISAVAAAQGAAAGGSTLTLIKGALKLMAWTKAKTAVVAGVIVLLAVGTTTVTVTQIQKHWTYPWQVRPFNRRVLDQAPPQVLIVPSKFPPPAGIYASGDKRLGLAMSVVQIVVNAWNFRPHTRVIQNGPLPPGAYDFIASLPAGNAAGLQQEIQRRFGVVARRETLVTNVLALTVKDPNAPGLKRAGSRRGEVRLEPGEATVVNMPLADFLIDYLEINCDQPVLDQTGLPGNFDFDFKWDKATHQEGQRPDLARLNQALTTQLGLELVPTNLPVEFLVIEKAGD